MKFFVFNPVLGLIVSLVGIANAFDGKPADKKDRKSSEKIERSLTVDPNATITVCVASGKITVRGWEKKEVRVRSVDADQIEFRRIDRATENKAPAARIDVMIFDKSAPSLAQGDCQAQADVEMDVPAGATVQAQTREGDIHIAGVAAAYAGSQNGDIVIERAVKLVEAGSVGGSISVSDSSGRISLSSVGGGVEATNISPAQPDDSFEVGTVSGDIQLERVGNAKLSAKTVNGNVTMTGPLAKGGHYGFTTMSGDVNLELPADASFQLSAKISGNRDLISDFPLKQQGGAPPPAPAPKPMPPPPGGQKPAPPAKGQAPTVMAPVVVKPPVVVTHALRRVNAVFGDGDAVISVASFGGTLRLRKM
jgi:hypothetical protein